MSTGSKSQNAGEFVNSLYFGDEEALDAVALDAVALDAVALDAVALDAVAFDAVALDAVRLKSANHPAGCLFMLQGLLFNGRLNHQGKIHSKDGSTLFHRIL